jgi:hypothetical protein
MQKATKVTVAARIASTSSNLPEKSSPAKTSRFLTHSCGRRATIAARRGLRRGFEVRPSAAAESTCGSGLSLVRGAAMTREG